MIPTGEENYELWKNAAICISCISIIFTTGFGVTFFGRFYVRRNISIEKYLPQSYHDFIIFLSLWQFRVSLPLMYIFFTLTGLGSYITIGRKSSRLWICRKLQKSIKLNINISSWDVFLERFNDIFIFVITSVSE